MGDDLNALIEHLDLGPVHLAGISDGGVMVLDQALRRPDTVRPIVMIGTNYCVDEHTLGAAEGNRRRRHRARPSGRRRGNSPNATTAVSTRGSGRT